MKFKVLLAIFTLLTTAAMATDGKYTLTYRAENKWVAKEDIQTLRQAVVFFQNNNLKVKAICSTDDSFCKQRVDIINHIFNKQNVKQQISTIETSKNLTKNLLGLESINLDKNKYSSLFINYENKQLNPIKKSQDDISNFIKYAELKYLSQFKMYCQTVDQLCKDRFNTLNEQLGKTLTFKYNFSLYENSNLDDNQAQLISHRHDYNINYQEPKPILIAKTKKPTQPTTEIKKTDLKYSHEKNIIVFKDNSAELLILEKVKIENLIANSTNNKFKFACGDISNELCQERVRAIKDYALKNTSNIIIMEQFKYNIFKDYVLVIDNK